jgi:hypothetical protein
MDTIGLLSAWVGIVSFLAAILVTAAAAFLTPRFQYWWAKTSRKRGERRITKLLAYVELHNNSPDNRNIAHLVSLYSEAILTLIAAVTLVVVSIEILDLGPALLASILPFNIDAKMLTRMTGVLMLLMSYLFIFRLSYLGAKLRRETSSKKRLERALWEISHLRSRFDTPA